MRTRYRIDTYQKTYFVIDSFEQLMEATAPGLHARSTRGWRSRIRFPAGDGAGHRRGVPPRQRRGLAQRRRRLSAAYTRRSRWRPGSCGTHGRVRPSQAMRPARSRLPPCPSPPKNCWTNSRASKRRCARPRAAAGQGCGPEFERRLQAHLRSLRSMLDADGVAVAADALEAAQRVMVSADPAAPLLMLEMARDDLARPRPAPGRRAAAARRGLSRPLPEQMRRSFGTGQCCGMASPLQRPLHAVLAIQQQPWRSPRPAAARTTPT